MAPKNPSKDVDILDKLTYGFLIAGLFFLGLAVLGVVGELLGWWNDIGEWLIDAGSIVGVLLTAIALLLASTRGQVRGVAGTLGEIVATTETIARQAETTAATTLDTNLKMESVDRKLDKLGELDVIQFELDRQTGVLDDQLSVLGAIRDRL